jgi:hypothetical protein
LGGVASANNNDTASLMTASATLTCLVGALLVVARLFRMFFNMDLAVAMYQASEAGS